MVTSPDANNGKTINTINLAISFAQMGKRTLIIDSDMRNPTVHRMFNIPVTNGLSEILAGLTDNITVSKTNVENLSILSSGKIPPNPAELLASSRPKEILLLLPEIWPKVQIRLQLRLQLQLQINTGMIKLEKVAKSSANK